MENGFSEESFLPWLDRKLMKRKSSGLSSSDVPVPNGVSGVLEGSEEKSKDSIELLRRLAFLREEERETLSFRLPYSFK